jgi:glycosyltransferase involved in cell wall biosynthesis
VEKLQVDYILGRREEEVNGIHRYALEVIRHGGDMVDGRLIDYDPGVYSRLAGRLPALFYYPLLVARSRRESSVKHFCSHIQAHLLNYLRLKPSVVTCHDIYPVLSRDYPYTDRCMVKLGLRGMLKADRIIAVSEFTKHEIVRVLGYPADRITVVCEGVDHGKYRPLAEPVALPGDHSPRPGNKTLLYVGSEQPRKNLHLLLRAFAAVKKERGDVSLIKVGRPQWKEAREELLRRAEGLGIRDEVIFADYVPEEALPGLYNAADLFVFPSRYEGFGLPLLEAMACGCPVIASNTSSLPQVVGSAGIMLDPDDEGGFVDAICRVLEDRDLHEEMRRKGIEQAGKFSWEKTALETVAVYREALSGDTHQEGGGQVADEDAGEHYPQKPAD